MEFTVLLSVYKNEKSEYLDRSLESVLEKQSVVPNEVVLIKDGELTIELEEVIQKYQKKFSQLRVIPLEKNVGLGLALKRGVEEAKYNLIFRMDTDDIALDNRFEKQIEFLIKNPNIKILGTNAVDFEDNIYNIKNYRKFPETPEEIKNFSRRRCPFLHPTIAFYKDIILECGNYRDLLYFEDYDLFLRVLKNYEGYNMQENLLYFRSDKNLYKRRGGINYLKLEIKALTKFYNEGYINLYYYCTNIMIRIIFRICGNSLRSFLYKTFLRKGVKK